MDNLVGIARKAARGIVKALAAVAAVALAGSAWADTQKVGGYTYTYDISQYDGTTGAVITKVSPKASGALSIPSELGTYPVRSIGQYGLSCHSNLTSVTLPSTLTTIGRWAFNDCTSLTSVTIPDGVKDVRAQPFLGCSNLKKVDMPSSLEGIVTKDNSFSGCAWDLTLYYRWKSGSVTLHYFVVNLSGYDSAANIGFGGSTAVDLGSVTGMTVPSKINGHEIIRIDDYAFSGCTKLEAVSIPESVRQIGPYAFKDCSRLESLVLHDGITSIGPGAFQGCSKLARATLPDKLYSDSLTSNQFKDCSASLKFYRVVDVEYDDVLFRVAINGTTAQIGNGVHTSIATNTTGAVSIPSMVEDPRYGASCTVTGIGASAFSKCNLITSVSIPDSVTYINYSAFSCCYKLGEVAFGDASKLATIGGDAFYHCMALEDISLPSGVTSIGRKSFYQCTALTDVTIPSGVATMDNGAFMGCTALKTVTLPYGLTTINQNAFGGCTSLETAYVPIAFLDDDDLAARAFCDTPSTLTIKYCGSWEDASKTTWYYMTAKKDGGLFTELGHNSLTKTAVSPKPTGALSVPSKIGGLTLNAIGSHAFKGCTGITGISFNSPIKYIDDSAFYICTGLTAITIPGSVDWLGKWAFYDCLNLADVTIENGLSKLCTGAFAYCKKLAELTLPASVTTMENHIFMSCGALKKVTYLGDRPATQDGKKVYISSPYDLVSIVSSANATWITALEAGKWEDRAIETEKGPYVPPHYTVQYHKYDGSGTTAEQTIKVGEEKRLLWMASDLGWMRDGYEFIGWVPWNPDTKPRLCKYVNGQKVKDLAKDGETVHLWCGWKSSSSYRVCFNKNDGSGEKMNQVILRNKEDTLAWLDSQLEWTRPGYTFKGWAETYGGEVKYANGAKVKNLAMNGGTKNLYAIWAGKKYTVQYHKYDGSGATKEQTMTVGKEQRLLWMDSQLGWMREGYAFVGWVPWNPDSKPRLCKYANGELVKDLALSGGKFSETVHLWCGWKSPSSYRVCFNKNDGSGTKLNQVILRNKEATLAWLDSQLEWTREGYSFQGWAETASGAVKYANGAKVKNLAMNGGTKNLYAIWKATKSVAKYAAAGAQDVGAEDCGAQGVCLAPDGVPVIEGELADGSGVFCLVMGEDGAVLYLGDGEGWVEEKCEAAPDGDEVVVTIGGEVAYRITFTDTVPLLL